jgi:hypothetical protein
MEEGVVTFNVLVVIVILNVIATIALWQTAVRRPEKVKKKFFAALMDNKPIVPKHQRPKSIGEGWGVCDQDRKFFADGKRNTFRDTTGTMIAQTTANWTCGSTALLSFISIAGIARLSRSKRDNECDRLKPWTAGPVSPTGMPA